MQYLNPGQSREYFDSLVDEREEGAVNVIHGAWLEHKAPLGRLEHLEPTTPLDMLLLYQAAAATFRDWVGGIAQPEDLACEGRIVNRELAMRKLKALADPELAALATRFANRVIALSNQSAADQDLNYYVELFLRSFQDKRVIDGVVSGSIARRNRELADPDFW
jgi:hypothetical protein